MDLPPSGWYPDPYGVPGLLRWWDGTAWTEHTFAETTAQAAATTAQPAVTAEQPLVRDMRPPAGPPTSPQPAIPQDYAGDGTRVLRLDNDAWTGDGAAYHRLGGRRRVILAAGLAGGVAVALAVIALVVNSMGQSPGAPVSDQNVPVPATAAASSSPSAAPSASASPSATAAATAAPTQAAMSSLSDATSGLSYGQLPAPWGPGCPAGLGGQAFNWTAGESAVAGQLPNGQTSNGQPDWYGVACSGPLPQQYGYNGTADLENVATTLANTFNGAYYSALPHSFQAVESQPVSVSGHPGWEVKFLLTYTSPQGLAWTNEMGAVVVADPGTGAAPAVFYVSVPGNLNEANVDPLVSSLQLTAVVPPPSTAPASPPA
jgi:hypothetical protein